MAHEHSERVTDKAGLLDLADDWAAHFRLVSDPTRLRLLLLLHFKGSGSAPISELAEAAHVLPATASAALKQLTLAGVITPNRKGREILYSITDERTHRLLHYLGAGHKHD